MKTITFVFLFSLLFLTPVNAMTGNNLVKYCGYEKGTFENGVCLGLIAGVRNVYSLLNARPPSIVVSNGETHKFKKFCIPEGVEFEQVEKIIIKWFNKNPENLHREFYSQYPVIMRETFPCKKK